LIIILAVIPATAIALAATAFISTKENGIDDRKSKTVFILVSLLSSASFLCLTFAALASF